MRYRRASGAKGIRIPNETRSPCRRQFHIDETLRSTFSCEQCARRILLLTDLPFKGADVAVATRESLAAAAAQPGAPTARARLGWLMFWMSGTLLAFIVAALSVRALAPSLDAFEMMTIRSAGGLAILLAMAIARPALWHSVSLRHKRLQLARNVVHFG